MKRKYPRNRNVQAHGLEQGQFKPQVIRNKKRAIEDDLANMDGLDDVVLDDILLDPDFDL